VKKRPPPQRAMEWNHRYETLVMGATLLIGEEKDPMRSGFNWFLARWPRRHLRDARGD